MSVTRRMSPREKAHMDMNAAVFARTGWGVADMARISREFGHVLDEYEYEMGWRARWAFLTGLVVANITWLLAR